MRMMKHPNIIRKWFSNKPSAPSAPLATDPAICGTVFSLLRQGVWGTGALVLTLALSGCLGKTDARQGERPGMSTAGEDPAGFAPPPNDGTRRSGAGTGNGAPGSGDGQGNGDGNGDGDGEELSGTRYFVKKREAGDLTLWQEECKAAEEKRFAAATENHTRAVALAEAAKKELSAAQAALNANTSDPILQKNVTQAEATLKEATEKAAIAKREITNAIHWETTGGQDSDGDGISDTCEWVLRSNPLCPNGMATAGVRLDKDTLKNIAVQGAKEQFKRTNDKVFENAANRWERDDNNWAVKKRDQNVWLTRSMCMLSDGQHSDVSKIFRPIYERHVAGKKSIETQDNDAYSMIFWNDRFSNDITALIDLDHIQAIPNNPVVTHQDYLVSGLRYNMKSDDTDEGIMYLVEGYYEGRNLPVHLMRLKQNGEVMVEEEEDNLSGFYLAVGGNKVLTSINMPDTTLRDTLFSKGKLSTKSCRLDEQAAGMIDSRGRKTHVMVAIIVPKDTQDFMGQGIGINMGEEVNEGALTKRFLELFPRHLFTITNRPRYEKFDENDRDIIARQFPKNIHNSLRPQATSMCDLTGEEYWAKIEEDIKQSKDDAEMKKAKHQVIPREDEYKKEPVFPSREAPAWTTSSANGRGGAGEVNGKKTEVVANTDSSKVNKRQWPSQAYALPNVPTSSGLDTTETYEEAFKDAGEDDVVSALKEAYAIKLGGKTLRKNKIEKGLAAAGVTNASDQTRLADILEPTTVRIKAPPGFKKYSDGDRAAYCADLETHITARQTYTQDHNLEVPQAFFEHIRTEAKAETEC